MPFRHGQMPYTSTGPVPEASLGPPSCNHSSSEPDTHLSTQIEFWKMFVLTAFCLPELRLWLYHHVSSQIAVRGLEVGSAREAAVLDSQTRHVSPPYGGANMSVLRCQTPKCKVETQLQTTTLQAPAQWRTHTHMHVHTCVRSLPTNTCLRAYSFRVAAVVFIFWKYS